MPTTAKGDWRPWEPGDPVRVLPWGKSGVGKTFGAGTFPRPCFFDYDRGLGTLYSPEFLRKYPKQRFLHRSFWEKDFKSGIVSAHTAYDASCKYFDEMMKRSSEFDTFVIDSGTTLGEVSQNKAVILLGTKEYNFQSKTQEQALQYGMLVPKVQDYGAERSLTEQFVDMILSTDKHVVMICHEKEQYDKNNTLIALTPRLTGQSAEIIPLRFDEVYHIQSNKAGADYDKATNTTVIKWNRICVTQPDGYRQVKTRNGVPDGTEWNYQSVLAALTKSYEERVRLLAAQAAGDKASAPLAATTPAGVKAS